ncbi:MAG: hypothetical protein IJP29_01390 [Lachnospiraceae bacterium]|nr:hypothetical protein [Lachnospiraceae bacterium]
MKKYFLIWDEIEKKNHIYLETLIGVQEQLRENENEMVIKSLFAYGVSMFENAMTEILKSFFLAFPEKMTEKDVSVKKEQILNHNFELEMKILETTINKLTYGPLNKYVSEFTKVLSIEDINEEKVGKLLEIKETRNLMIHNNLIVNTIYLSKCGEKYVRADIKMINKQLPFNKQYACESMKLCIDILRDEIIKPLTEKYNSFTKIKAMKEIWNYLFDSPILNFDEYWQYDTNGRLKQFCLDKDTIEGRLEAGFSSTEKMLVSYILMHYWGTLRRVENVDADVFNHNYLYGERKEKFLYLQDVLFRYPQLFEQDI